MDNSRISLSFPSRLFAGMGLAMLLLQPVQAAGWDIDQLMQSMAQIRSGQASFLESKNIAMLNAPIVSEGELFYTAPDRLEKRTIKPKPESMVLQGGTLTIEQGRKKHVLQLQRYPEVAAFIESIRATMAGDRQALERTYALTLSGDSASWALELVPLNDAMKKVVQKIEITGVQNELRNILISQADGDSSLMTITRLQPR